MSLSSNFKTLLDTAFGANSSRQSFTDALATAFTQEQCFAYYANTIGQSIPNSTTTILNFDSKLEDTDNAVTTGSGWKFTCPTGKGGLYTVSYAIDTAGLTNPSTFFTTLYKNNNASTSWRGSRINASSQSLTGSAVLRLAAGDTLAALVFQSTGGAVSLEVTATGNWIAIARIPGSG